MPSASDVYEYSFSKPPLRAGCNRPLLFCKDFRAPGNVLDDLGSSWRATDSTALMLSRTAPGQSPSFTSSPAFLRCVSAPWSPASRSSLIAPIMASPSCLVAAGRIVAGLLVSTTYASLHSLKTEAIPEVNARGQSRWRMTIWKRSKILLKGNELRISFLYSLASVSSFHLNSSIGRSQKSLCNDRKIPYQEAPKSSEAHA